MPWSARKMIGAVRSAARPIGLALAWSEQRRSTARGPASACRRSGRAGARTAGARTTAQRRHPATAQRADADGFGADGAVGRRFTGHGHGFAGVNAFDTRFDRL